MNGHPMVLHKRLKQGLLLTGLATAVAALAFLAWQHLYPAVAGPGWSYGVYRDNVGLVSALARDARGTLYIALEQNRQRGTLVKLQPDGAFEEVMAGLDKPDGLAGFRGGILVSQEGGDYPLLWLHDGQVDRLFKGRDIEGIDADADHIYAIEDLKGVGRLLRHDPLSGRTVSLRDGLDEAEGVAICPDGRLFYSEKKKGWIKQYRQGAGEDRVVLSGLNAPGFLMCNPDGLWVAEDATHGAHVLRVDAVAGVAHVVLARLRSAQAVLPLAPGRLLVAEQGRHRILEIRRDADETR